VSGGDRERLPGLAVVFSAGTATVQVMSLAAGPLELGRSDGPGKLDDGRISRRHAAVALVDGRFVVTDLGSQNGTSIDGRPIAAQMPTPVERVIRVGDSLLVPCTDVRPLAEAGVQRQGGFVRGPAMQRILDEAAAAGRAGTPLHVRGESGSGKEGVVQAFHRGSARTAGALVAVNCAAIPHAIAERLLFGAKRGAYSGAEADASGYIQDADGGTLFLDEIAELDAQVQAKLLRVLESKELMPLGASKPRRVDFALCSATNKDLRALVATGAWREDLYFRIARPAVVLPPLRQRPEEIPALIVDELARLSPAATAHVSLVEQCLLRPWPGNVRELLAELRAAAQLAQADGHRVTAHHLAATAGTVFGASTTGTTAPAAASPAATAPASPPSDTPADEARRRAARDPVDWALRITESLRIHGGNVAATARALGLHRTQLRRMIAQHGIAVDAIAGRPDSAADDTD